MGKTPEQRQRHTEYMRDYRKRNPEYVTRYAEKHPERIKEYRAAYVRPVYAPEYYLAVQRKRKYGITQEQWDALFTSQGKCCAICGTTEPGGKRTWHTDHCHESKKVRGILCHTCNVGLGNFKDNPQLLNHAATYLLRTSEKE